MHARVQAICSTIPYRRELHFPSHPPSSRIRSILAFFIRIYRVTIAVLVILGRRTRALQQFELTCLPSSSTREATKPTFIRQYCTVLLYALHVYYKGLGKITILKIMCLERFVLKGCVFLAPAERRARTRDSPNLSIEYIMSLK